VTEPVEFGDADHVEVGAFGEPGQRVFLLQVRQSARVLTVKVEKGQVAELATHLSRAIADRPPSEPPPAAARLEESTEPEWVVGSIRLGYDNAADRVAVVLEELQLEPDAEAAAAMIMISADQASALITEIAALVEAGRPACPHCGYPLDPSGHVCPKSNGHRPPKL
jgi:uncharacterized repeat protein (TIGR03847 family)